MDAAWLQQVLLRLKLRPEAEYSVSVDERGGDEESSLFVSLHSPRWVSFFCAELGEGAKRGDSERGAECSRGIASWALTKLNKSQLRALLRGLHRAGGSAAGGAHLLFTRSVRFRDELQLLCLHAGYSAFFALQPEPETGQPAWCVQYSEESEAAEPVLCLAGEVRERVMHGRVWCVDAPPHRLIITRRAFLDPGSGVVTKASLPVVVGNCLFGKGLTLDTPERVPFRLTANIIDGLGLSGIEGVYRRSCEVTMAVMKESSQTLLSVLHTFLYDPLLEWKQQQQHSSAANNTSIVTLLPPPVAGAHAGTAAGKERDREREGGAGGAAGLEFTTAAEKLAEVESKLSGVVPGSKDAFPLSVNGQVDTLIKDACNEQNLAQMYMGWMPWI